MPIAKILRIIAVILFIIANLIVYYISSQIDPANDYDRPTGNVIFLLILFFILSLPSLILWLIAKILSSRRSS